MLKNKTPLLLASILILILLGTFMMLKTNKEPKIENFDDYWGLLGYPNKAEQKFLQLLPQAEALKDKSIYLQILSQIAIAQAMQKKFDAAHATLNKAEALVTNKDDVAYARIVLERGRTFHQEAILAGKSENLLKAKSFFEKSFEVCQKNHFDYHSINAAHMIAIVTEKPQDKIKWNQIALELAKKAKDKKAKLWFGSIYNNLGMNFLEIKQYEKVLEAFQKALKYRKKEKIIGNLRLEGWQIARTLRLLGRFHEARPIAEKLQDEYEAIEKSGKFDMPIEMFKLTRGLVYEELAEIYDAKAKECAKFLYLDNGSKDPLYDDLTKIHTSTAKRFAGLAYTDLSQDPIFSKTETKRLERLKELQKIKIKKIRKDKYSN